MKWWNRPKSQSSIICRSTVSLKSWCTESSTWSTFLLALSLRQMGSQPDKKKRKEKSYVHKYDEWFLLTWYNVRRIFSWHISRLCLVTLFFQTLHCVRVVVNPWLHRFNPPCVWVFPCVLLCSRWWIRRTPPTCLPPTSPRSVTSSWALSTVYFVSPKQTTGTQQQSKKLTVLPPHPDLHRLTFTFLSLSPTVP